MFLALVASLVRILVNLLRRAFSALFSRRAIKRAARQIEGLVTQAWIEEGADPTRAVLPRGVQQALERLLGEAIRGAMGRRDALTSDRQKEAWARSLAGSILASLNRALARSSGSTGYIWTKTRSAQPRDEHLKRVGRFYAWGQLEDEPGDAWGCKCGAIPVFE